MQIARTVVSNGHVVRCANEPMIANPQHGTSVFATADELKPGMTRRITLGFGLATCIIVVMMVLSYQRTHEMASASKWVVHSNEVLVEVEATIADITEAEAAVRGLLLTDDKTYLESWQSGKKDAPLRLGRLSRLIMDNPDQQARLSVFASAAKDKLDWVAQMVDVNRSGRQQQAIAMMKSGIGRLKMARLRQTAADLEKEEKRLLQIRTEATEVKTRHATNYLRILAATVLIVLCLAFYLVRTEMSERARVQLDFAHSQEKLKQALQREQELSRVDLLTNVANRRAFYEALEVESRRAKRSGKPLSLVYLDLDNFKAINDSLGHAVGDVLLARVASIIRANIRAGSCVARLGGDEFAIMIPEASASETKRFLQRLRGLLLEQMQANQWPVTFSIGAAVFQEAFNSVEEMVHAADQEMYAVKNRCKNDISVATVEAATA